MKRKELGVKLSALFKEMFLSRMAVAERLNLNLQTIHRWCAGYTMPSMDNQRLLVALADKHLIGNKMRDLLSLMNKIKA